MTDNTPDSNHRFFSSHAKHADLAARCATIATRHGLVLRHNVSGGHNGGYDGNHRYLVLRPGFKTNRCTSRDCLISWQAPYSRIYLPTQKAERACLTAMLEYVTAHAYCPYCATLDTHADDCEKPSDADAFAALDVVETIAYLEDWEGLFPTPVQSAHTQEV